MSQFFLVQCLARSSRSAPMPDSTAGRCRVHPHIIICRRGPGCPAGQQKGRWSMQAKDRRKIEMGDRAAEFGQANPADSAAYTALLGVLDELRTRAQASAAQQLDGVAQVRGARLLRKDLE